MSGTAPQFVSAEQPTGHQILALLATFVVSALLGAAVWGAGLGWGHGYYYDESVGANQGPYRPGQVVGCAITVGLLTGLLAGGGIPWPSLRGSPSASGPGGP